jgi:hypothetical protein
MCLLCTTHTGLCFVYGRLLLDYIAKLLARRIWTHPPKYQFPVTSLRYKSSSVASSCRLFLQQPLSRF